MLAMVVNDDAGSLTPRGALSFFASMLAPTGDWVHSRKSGRLAGAKIKRSQPSAVPTVRMCYLRQSRSSVSSPRLLLILIHPPLRKAEWRRSSGDWRAAPFDAVEHIACRCQRSQPEGDAPG
ncbi:hypothetical protein DM828_15780 [Pseudomonas umsongensis]|nr:hypothetical protein [Pseudomonas umsongensis]